MPKKLFFFVYSRGKFVPPSFVVGTIHMYYAIAHQNPCQMTPEKTVHFPQATSANKYMAKKNHNGEKLFLMQDDRNDKYQISTERSL